MRHVEARKSCSAKLGARHYQVSNVHLNNMTCTFTLNQQAWCQLTQVKPSILELDILMLIAGLQTNPGLGSRNETDLHCKDAACTAFSQLLQYTQAD
jgi:hypothetical protein